MNLKLHNHFIVRIKKPDGSITTNKAFNLVTDYGKDKIMSATLPSYIHLGTGTTEPSTTDKNLASKKVSLAASRTTSFDAASLVTTITLKITIDENTAADTNFTEIGVGDASYVFTRALFTDSQGSPIVVPKGAHDIMEVTAIVYVALPSTYTPDLLPGTAGTHLRRTGSGLSISRSVGFAGVAMAGGLPLGAAHTAYSVGLSSTATTGTASMAGAVTHGWFNAGCFTGGYALNSSKGGTMMRSYGYTAFDEQLISDYAIGTGDGSNSNFPIVYVITNKESIDVKINGESVPSENYTVEPFGMIPLQTDTAGSSSTSLFFPAKAGADNKVFNEVLNHYMTDSSYTMCLYSDSATPFTKWVFEDPTDSSKPVTLSHGMTPNIYCSFGTTDSGTYYGYYFINGEWALACGNASTPTYTLDKYDPITGETISTTVTSGSANYRWDIIPLGDTKEEGFITALGRFRWDAEQNKFVNMDATATYVNPTYTVSSSYVCCADFHGYLTAGDDESYNFYFANFMVSRKKYHTGVESVTCYVSSNPSYTYDGVKYTYYPSTYYCAHYWDPISGNCINYDYGNQTLLFGTATYTWDDGNSRYNISNWKVLHAIKVTDLGLYASSSSSGPCISFVDKDRLLVTGGYSTVYAGNGTECFIDIPDRGTTWTEDLPSKVKVTRGHKRTLQGSVTPMMRGATNYPVFWNDKYIITSLGDVLTREVYQIKFKTPPEPDAAITVTFRTNTICKDESWNLSTTQSIGYVD